MRGALILAAVLAAHAAAPSAQTIAADDLTARAGSYAREFFAALTHIVAEERYVQESQSLPVVSGSGINRRLSQSTPTRRDLRSDVLLVKTTDTSDWMLFRDVYAVNGKPVRDREDRLTKLFLQPSPDAIRAASTIAREGARYNLGSPGRTINNPLLALAYLQSHYQSHFDFSVEGRDRTAGTDVWIVRYKERSRPTLLRMADDKDMASTGRFWIEAGSGRVVKTQLLVLGSDEITSSFAFDQEIGAYVPVEMRESYPWGFTSITGVATYSRFRRFQVSTEEKLQK